MSSFFSSLADKAQSAIDTQYSQIQSKLRGPEHGGSGRPTALDAINYQFRNLQMQYSSSIDPVQRIITVEKGVMFDFENVAKDSKMQSKELYMWGKQESPDIKDVTDRLGYLNYVLGQVSGDVSAKLDEARASLKKLRNAERAIEPKRNVRLNLYNQIGRMEQELKKSPANDKRIAELKEQLHKAEENEEPEEREMAILKRKAIAESESAKWAALREYGEKIILLAEASDSIIAVLPSVPPSDERPYQGAQETAAARASLQHALDNYKPGALTHSFQPSPAHLERSDSRSFGVTHETELSSITTETATDSKEQQQDQEHTTTAKAVPPPVHPQVQSENQTQHGGAASAKQPSPPVNPAKLNTARSPIPEPTSAQIASPPEGAIPDPTMAETGQPVRAGAGGPGPASGSIAQLRAEKAAAAAGVNEGGEGGEGSVPKYVEDGAAPAEKGKDVKYESAEEEKKRLEREQTERLRSKEAEAAKGEGDGTPPPYEEFGRST